MHRPQGLLLQLLVLLLAVGGSVAAAAAAPTPPPRRARVGPRPAMLQTRLLALERVVPPAAVSAQECPGAEGRQCGRQCQLRLCQALADLYRASNNVSDPWDHEQGWELTTTQSCQQLLPSAPQQQQPAYCSWHGVICCDERMASQQRCWLRHSVKVLNLASNNLNVSLQNPVLFRSLKTLHDCGMTGLDFESNNIEGSLTAAWGSQLMRLQYLNLGTCWISGRLPDGLSKMRNLTYLNVGNNWLSGTFPELLADLKLLRVLNLGSQFGDNGEGSHLPLGLYGTISPRISELASLRELVLEANSLSGNLPTTLCSKDAGSLLVLNLRGNQLQGSATAVENCKRLVQLDISSNMFVGRLPARRWEQLATYRANDNQFTGTWPRALSEARILEYLNLNNNNLTGEIPASITLMSSLKSVRLSHNRLSGSIPDDVYFLPALSVLDLGHNQFVGFMPDAIGLSYNLAELDLSHNPGLTGVMPPQMALTPRLQTVRLQQTSTSCAGIIRPYTVTTNPSCTDVAICKTPQKFGDDEPIRRCTEHELLPCFLGFSGYFVPRDDSSNMKCKVLMRKHAEQAQQDCRAELGEQAGSLPEGPTDRWVARWEVDPSYYQYQACECLLGFTALWDATGTVLTCVPEQRNASHRDIIIAVAVAGAAVLAVALVVWRQYLRTRPRWLRERLLQAKRYKGPPKASKPGDRVLVTVLVTDVQDFSLLTRKHPELMNKAMGGHNNILRKACHAHAGHIMDQEGDSWTIAFHDAEDAVAFSLQVQQALSQKVWSLKMNAAGSPDSSTTGRPLRAMPSQTAQPSEHSASSSYDLMGSGAPPTPALSATAGTRGPGGGGASAGSRAFGSFSAASDDRASSRTSNADQAPGALQQQSRSRDCSFSSVQGQAAAGDIELGMVGSGAADTSVPRQLQLQCASQDLCGMGDDDTQPSRDTNLQQQQQRQQQQQQQQFLKSLMGRLSPLAGGSSTSKRNHPPPSGAARDLLPESPMAGAEVSQPSGSLATAPSSRASSRLYSAGSTLVHRLSRVMRGNLHTGLLPPLGPETHGELRLCVRIGICTGWLFYGSSLDNCAVKDLAKNYVSDAANGGQVLMDERTFKLTKHSLSALGTVDENGYNDRQLQQLMQAQVVAKMQRIACGAGCCSSSSDKKAGSFTGASSDQVLLLRDYGTDALVVHMGAFTAPQAASVVAGDSSSKPPPLPPLTSTSDNSTQSAEDDEDDGECAEQPSAAAAVAAAARARRRRRNRRASLEGRGGGTGKVHLQLYAIAAPKMRRRALHTSELQAYTAWCKPVRLKPGWVQVQKDYFQAPGARPEDLTAHSHQESVCRQPLPPVTFVFAEVQSAYASFAHKHHQAELHSLNKAIRRSMLQLMSDVPGGGGYMCRHDPDLRFMVAWQSPASAVQWCLLVQEALMYLDYSDHILSLPGFQEVTDAETGLLLFRGPRLSMGVTEGVPSCVLPDHTGRTNFTGGAVNRAARFMDVAAQPGQVVCELSFAQRCLHAWRPGAGASGRQTWGSAADCVSPESIPESAAATDWGENPQASLMQLMALRSQSETSGHCRPATGPQGLRSRALHELWYSQQQLKHEQKDMYRRQMHKQQLDVQRGQREPPSRTDRQPGGGGAAAAGAPAGGSSVASFSRGAGALSSTAGGSFSTRFSPLSLGGATMGALPLPGSAMSAGRQPQQPQQQQLGGGGGVLSGSVAEDVSCSFIGTFSFKGSGVFEMVQLQHSVLQRRPFPQEARGKGMKLSEASGRVGDVPQVQLVIPARLLMARQAYAARLAASEACSLGA